MEIVIEILLELYMELMLLIIPEEKRGKKHYIFATIVASVFTLGILALGVWGIVWIVEEKNTWGWLPLSVAITLSLVQIISGIVLCVRKHGK